MTVIDAIHKVDALKPNTYTQNEKIRWLSELDGVIKKEIIDTHEGGENIFFKPYKDDNDLTTQLIVPFPYDRLYLPWLQAQIDYHNGETGKYQNSMAMFNAAYTAFEKYYNRTNMPKGAKMKFF